MEIACKNFFCSMCKDREGDHRTCALPRCCSICPIRFDGCEFMCVVLRDKDLKETTIIPIE